MAYCDKTMYVIEALYANPHKYGESEKQTLREHMVECEICLEAAHNTEQASKGMYHNFDL